MTQLQELVVPLKFNSNDFESGIERSITKASAFGSFMGNIAATAVTGAFTLLGKGIQAVGGFLADSVKEAASSQESLSQLQAVLKSTGGVAGVTEKQATDLASSLQKVTRFSDEAILGGENMLLTFTNIGEKIFPQATETILDMSQALGQDLKSSAIQLGKALNDPISGVTALQRVGVKFTDEQISVIESLVKTGELEKAQAMILKELQVEFGGSAKAAGQTFAGQLDILKNKLSDIKENIGNALLPVLQNLTTRFSTLIDSPEFQKTIDFVITKLGEFVNWLTEKAIPALIDFKDRAIKAFEEGGLGGLADFIIVELGKLDEELANKLDNVDWAGLGTRFGDWVDEQLSRNFETDGNLLPKFVISFTDGLQEALLHAALGANPEEAWKAFFDNVHREGDSQVRTFFINWEVSWTAAIRKWGITVYNEIVKWIAKFTTTLNGTNLNLPTIPTTNTSRNSNRTGRATGGPVIGGQPYNILELGKSEVFTPNTSGRVDPVKPQIVQIDEDKLAKIFGRVLGEQLQKVMA